MKGFRGTTQPSPKGVLITFKKVFQDYLLRENRKLTLLLLASFVLKLLYGLTRDAFPSGPDAPTYIQAILDLSQNSPFSKDIEGIPKWPIGYPLIFSITPLIFGDYWVFAVQVLQALLSTIAVFFAYRLVKPVFGSRIAFITAGLIALHPVWITSSAMAMYEPVLLFLMLGALYFYSKINYNRSERENFYIFLSSCFSGVMIVVHPRILFIFLFIQLGILIRLHRTRHYRALIYALPFSFGIPALAIYRNWLYDKTLALNTSVWDSMTIGHSGSGKCRESWGCYLKFAFESPVTFLSDSLRNTLYFFSPYSGELSRGTWFHRFTLERFLPDGKVRQLFTIIVVCFLIASVCLWIFGVTFAPINRSLKTLLFLEVAAMIATAALIYGDSRHRIIASPLMLPFQIWTALHIYKILNSKSRLWLK